MRYVSLVSAALLAASLSAQLPDGSMPGPRAMALAPSSGGTGPLATCASLNPTQSTNATTGWANAWFVHKVTGVAASSKVNGFSFLCRQNTAGLVPTGIFDDAAGVPGGAVISAGSMTVGTASAFCATVLGTPYTVGASGAFWIGYNLAAGPLGFNVEAGGGTIGTYYWNGPPAWSGPWAIRPFAWTVDCSGLPATISPLGAGSGLGNSNNNIPFSWSPTSYQQVHTLGSFTSQAPALFSQMRLRMASGFTGFAGKTIDIEMFMARSPNDSTTANATFANNEAAGTVVAVITRKMIALPTVPTNDWAVAPFMFDAPFPFAATHISWRTNCYGNSNGNALFTYPLDAWSGATAGSAVNLGVGCKATNGSAPATHTSTVGLLGGQLALSGNSMIASNDPAIVTIGASTTTWGAFTLPLNLGIIGAPLCNVYNDLAVTIAGVTASGAIAHNITIPNSPVIASATLHTQYVVVNAGANAAGVITTNTRSNTFGTFLGVTRNYALSAPPVAGGTLGVNYGMAVGFN